MHLQVISVPNVYTVHIGIADSKLVYEQNELNVILLIRLVPVMGKLYFIGNPVLISHRLLNKFLCGLIHGAA